MRRTQGKPNSIRRECFPRFRQGSLAVLRAMAKAGNMGDARPGGAVPAEAIVQNKANFLRLGSTLSRQREKGYDDSRLKGAPRKQSQFAGAAMVIIADKERNYME